MVVVGARGARGETASASTLHDLDPRSFTALQTWRPDYRKSRAHRLASSGGDFLTRGRRRGHAARGHGAHRAVAAALQHGPATQCRGIPAPSPRIAAALCGWRTKPSLRIWCHSWGQVSCPPALSSHQGTAGVSPLIGTDGGPLLWTASRQQQIDCGPWGPGIPSIDLATLPDDDPNDAARPLIKGIPYSHPLPQTVFFRDCQLAWPVRDELSRFRRLRQTCRAGHPR